MMCRRKTPSAVISSILLVASLNVAVALASTSALTDIDDRVQRLEQWLKAVLHHQPGTTDESASIVGSWSIDQLTTLATDQAV